MHLQYKEIQITSPMNAWMYVMYMCTHYTNAYMNSIYVWHQCIALDNYDEQGIVLLSFSQQLFLPSITVEWLPTSFIVSSESTNCKDTGVINLYVKTGNNSKRNTYKTDQR